MNYNIDDVKDGKKNFVMQKMITIGVLLFVLMIPLMAIHGVVKDRQKYQNEVSEDVAKSWGQPQVLGLPVVEYYVNAERVSGPPVETTGTINVDTSDIKRSVYNIPVYTADVSLKGAFVRPINADAMGKLRFEVSDAKGFVEAPVVMVNGKRLPCFGTTCSIENIDKLPQHFSYEVRYKLKGTERIRLDIAGGDIDVKINSKAKNVTYIGDYTPNNNSVENGGYDASWVIPKSASFHVESKYRGDVPSFGVSYKNTMDIYKLTDRVIKYGFLFLALTFLAFFVFEVIKGKNAVHPFQYGLIAFSLLVFYLLLLSISEFMNFGFAYLIASVMTICLISWYTYFVLTKQQDGKFSLVIAGILGILYSYLYVLLNVREASLLLGSIGLFIIAFVTMYATRNINWYKE